MSYFITTETNEHNVYHAHILGQTRERIDTYENKFHHSNLQLGKRITCLKFRRVHSLSGIFKYITKHPLQCLSNLEDLVDAAYVTSGGESGEPMYSTTEVKVNPVVQKILDAMTNNRIYTFAELCTISNGELMVSLFGFLKLLIYFIQLICVL